VVGDSNRGDLDDVPDEVRDEMTFHPVMTIGEVSWPQPPPHSDAA